MAEKQRPPGYRAALPTPPPSRPRRLLSTRVRGRRNPPAPQVGHGLSSFVDARATRSRQPRHQHRIINEKKIAGASSAAVALEHRHARAAWRTTQQHPRATMTSLALCDRGLARRNRRSSTTSGTSAQRGADTVKNAQVNEGERVVNLATCGRWRIVRQTEESMTVQFKTSREPGLIIGDSTCIHQVLSTCASTPGRDARGKVPSPSPQTTMTTSASGRRSAVVLASPTRVPAFPGRFSTRFRLFYHQGVRRAVGLVFRVLALLEHGTSNVNSEPGKGTTFSSASSPRNGADGKRSARHGDDLVVDDERILTPRRSSSKPTATRSSPAAQRWGSWSMPAPGRSGRLTDDDAGDGG